MKRHRPLRQISCLLLILGISQFYCSGDETPPPPPIADVSVSSEAQAWIVTRDGKLFHVETPNQVEEETRFRSKARLVYFVNPSVGWVLDSDGQFWSMTDGANWQQRGALVDLTTRLHASHLAFANERIGWLTTSFGLWLTTDAGEHWTEIPVDTKGAQPAGFFPVDSETGWLLLTNGKMSKTADRGKSWNLTDLGVNSTIRAFYSDGRENNWAGGADGSGGLFHINSLGRWEQALDENQRVGIGIQSISFPTPQHGWLCGLRFAKDPNSQASGVIMKTIDGGNSWTKLPTSLPDNQFIDIKFLNETEGWLASEATLYHTSDAGQSWTKVSSF